MMGDDLMLFEALVHCAFEDLRDQFHGVEGVLEGWRNAECHEMILVIPSECQLIFGLF